jgi:hypothetical protein
MPISDSENVLVIPGNNWRRGLPRHAPRELFVIQCLLDPYFRFSRIQDSLHEYSRYKHEAAAGHDCGQAIVVEEAVHHPSEEQ